VEILKGVGREDPRDCQGRISEDRRSQGHKGREMSETEEWEIEILAFVKGKENTSDLAFELLQLLKGYPYTYFDMKLTPYKPNTTEKWRIRAEHHKETTKNEV